MFDKSQKKVMKSTDLYLEPLKYYEHFLKEQHLKNVEECFEGIAKDSKVDIEGNKSTCKKYYAENNALTKLKKSLSATKAGIVIMFILMIGGLIGGIITLVGGITSGGNVPLIIIGVVLLVVAVAALILFITVFRQRKKNLQSLVDKKQKVVDQLQLEAYRQVEPLNGALTPDLATKLMEKTAPLIDFDEYLSSKTEDRIVRQFKDKLDASIDHSTLVVQSGNINTNPFILRQKLVMEMKPEIYTGTLLITYTRTVSDGQGGTRTVTVTQTLTASITEPKPHYSVQTGLTYYTDAASQLSFYRTPAGLVGKSEKQIDKAVQKEERENTRLAEKAVKKGQNYTKFGNSKFEAFINSEKRDNEVEYRILFTPLAQNNFVYSFSKNDDIYFDKKKCVNNIYSTHDTNMDYSGDISNYYHFDYEVIKKNFTDYNVRFFDGLYFDMIPLLNIPLYHQHQSAPFVDNSKESIISYYEAEVLVNKFDPNLFKPSDCDTDVILKPSLDGRNLLVNAYGFKAVPKTQFVPTLGGDGIMHPVPVHYFEYQRVNCITPVNLINKKKEKVDNESGTVVNYRQYQALLLKN